MAKLTSNSSKKNVPIVTYEDIKLYIDRIANGEPSDILLAEPLTGFFRSSGTSGGQLKLIPTTAELVNKYALFDALHRYVLTKHFSDINQAAKRMEPMFTKPDIETPSGLEARSVTTTLFKHSAFRTIASKLFTSPIETIFCSESDPKQRMYCQLLTGLLQRDEVVTVGAAFASTLLRAIKFLEGFMIQYTAELEFYCKGLPIVSDQVQFNGVSHHESIEMKSNNEDTEPVDLVNVKPGQCYELLVTTSTGFYRYRVGDILMVIGFHNNTPQFKFVERQNVILSIDADKTSESDLLKAVTEAKTLLDPLGFIMTTFTSYGDTSSTPGHYVLFSELKAKEDNNINELDPKTMVECCSRMEQSLGYAYESCRKQNAIAALEIRVVKQGTFDALMDYYVSQGASMSQYKTHASCIISKDALKILNSRDIVEVGSSSGVAKEGVVHMPIDDKKVNVVKSVEDETKESMKLNDKGAEVQMATYNNKAEINEIGNGAKGNEDTSNFTTLVDGLVDIFASKVITAAKTKDSPVDANDEENEENSETEEQEFEQLLKKSKSKGKKGTESSSLSGEQLSSSQ
ncbi:hypothetical protein PTKIN_Ptkin11bG0140400 [Pterospermum kingtungense]